MAEGVGGVAVLSAAVPPAPVLAGEEHGLVRAVHQHGLEGAVAQGLAHDEGVVGRVVGVGDVDRGGVGVVGPGLVMAGVARATSGCGQ